MALNEAESQERKQELVCRVGERDVAVTFDLA